MTPKKNGQKTMPRPYPAVVIANARGQVGYISRRGEQLLENYLGWVRRSDTLPVAFRSWLRSAVLGVSLVFEGEAGELAVNLLEPKSKAGYCLLLRESTPALQTAKNPLTAREREVLEWVAVGKSNRAIAQILGLATGTVRKHLQNSFPKLEVKNRTAAARIILEKRARGELRVM